MSQYLLKKTYLLTLRLKINRKIERRRHIMSYANQQSKNQQLNAAFFQCRNNRTD